jgi:WD40 repeat protein
VALAQFATSKTSLAAARCLADGRVLCSHLSSPPPSPLPLEELWRRQDGGQPGYMRNIAFSSDGSQLISTNDKGLLIWRVQDGQLLRTFPLPVGSLAMLSPDGSVAALYKEDGTITLLRLPDGQPLCTIKERFGLCEPSLSCIASSRCSAFRRWHQLFARRSLPSRRQFSDGQNPSLAGSRWEKDCRIAHPSNYLHCRSFP